MKMDPAHIQQIILNLVLNARDAMPDGGRVMLATRNCDAAEPSPSEQEAGCASWVVLAVTDTGCGMDAETRSRLFEPFFTTKKPGHGNGLGLATVHRIVTQEGGMIEVDSEIGRGTRVAVHLPRVEVKSQPSNALGVANKTRPVTNQKVQGPGKNKTGRGKSV